MTHSSQPIAANRASGVGTALMLISEFRAYADFLSRHKRTGPAGQSQYSSPDMFDIVCNKC